MGKRRKTKQGDVFGFLKAIEPTEKRKTDGSIVWLFECICGKVIERIPQQLRSKKDVSCGCTYKGSRLSHGMTGTKVYNTWNHIKDRCQNPKNPRYDKYKDLYIDPEWVKSFEKFYEDVGNPPTEELGRKWSIDRIDNTKGYYKENVRWASIEQQARNKGKKATNTSGKNGVLIIYYKGEKVGYKSCWYVGKNKKSTRSFYIKEYGDELAFFAASEHRDLMIERLNKTLDYKYGEKHGE